MVVQSPQENDMSADIGYLRAYDQELEAKKKKQGGHGATDGAEAAAVVTDREDTAQKAADAPSASEGAIGGAMSGASTGNPYVMAGMAAVGAIQASKKKKRLEFENRKTGQKKALLGYIDALGGMA